MTDPRAVAARSLFPRGLAQPEAGYRFSLDSLLLACFARPGPGERGADLGCGCGVVALGLLLRQPDLTLTGLELDPAALDAARENGDRLGFADRLTWVRGDVTFWRPEADLDFVVANPPYRRPGQGRTSRDAARCDARFETRADFAAFAAAGALALRTRGRFASVHLAERLAEVMAGLARARLEPKRLRMVHGRTRARGSLVLVEAVKGGGSGLGVEPPLILHQGQGQETRLTPQALEFCPFLACNP